MASAPCCDERPGDLDGVVARCCRPATQSVAEMRTRHRLVGRPGRAHRVEHLEREPQPVLQRAAVLVGALVRQRGEERGEQVAVGAVQLEQVEAGLARRAAAAATKSVDDLVQLGPGQLPRDVAAGAVGQRRRAR